jgi:hypothetical protein
MAVFPVDTESVASDVLESADFEARCGTKDVERPLLRLLGLFVPVDPGLSAGCTRAEITQDIDREVGCVAVLPPNDESAGFGKRDIQRVA